MLTSKVDPRRKTITTRLAPTTIRSQWPRKSVVSGVLRRSRYSPFGRRERLH